MREIITKKKRAADETAAEKWQRTSAQLGEGRARSSQRGGTKRLNKKIRKNGKKKSLLKRFIAVYRA